MKACVDKATCISCGICPTICPEVFEIKKDGKADVISSTVPKTSEHSASEACENCPVDAITVVI